MGAIGGLTLRRCPLGSYDYWLFSQILYNDSRVCLRITAEDCLAQSQVLQIRQPRFQGYGLLMLSFGIGDSQMRGVLDTEALSYLQLFTNNLERLTCNVFKWLSLFNKVLKPNLRSPKVERLRQTGSCQEV